MTNPVFVKQFGLQKASENPSQSFEELLQKTFSEVNFHGIDAVFLSSLSKKYFSVNSISSLVESYVGKLRLAVDCDDPVSTFQIAFELVSTGKIQNAIIFGIEKFSVFKSEEKEEIFSSLIPYPFNQIGMSFYDFLAIKEKQILQRLGVNKEKIYNEFEEKLANSIKSEFASYSKFISKEEIKKSRILSGEIHQFEMPIISDSAGFLIISNEPSDFQIKLIQKFVFDLDFDFLNRSNCLSNDCFEISDIMPSLLFLFKRNLNQKIQNSNKLKLNNFGGRKFFGDFFGLNLIREVVDCFNAMKILNAKNGFVFHLKEDFSDIFEVQLKKDD